jgi:septum formation protein
MTHIYLASSSSRRRELLQQIGVRYEMVSASVEEKRQAGESAITYVQRLAMEKAKAGLAAIQRDGRNLAPVLGADTLGVFHETILEKPRDEADAAGILRSLSGQTHEVITAVALVLPGQHKVEHSVTRVTFRHLSEQEIKNYWLTGEPCDKAGGYAIQGLGAVFVESIQGSYSNVVGLPLEVCNRLFKEFDIPVWQ